MSDLYLFFTFSLPKFNFPDGKPWDQARTGLVPGAQPNYALNCILVMPGRILSAGAKTFAQR